MSTLPKATTITPASVSAKFAPYSLTAVGWGFRLDGPGIPKPDGRNAGMIYEDFSQARDQIRLAHACYMAGRDASGISSVHTDLEVAGALADLRTKLNSGG